jgi:hypothetical protein
MQRTAQPGKQQVWEGGQPWQQSLVLSHAQTPFEQVSRLLAQIPPGQQG